MPIAIECPDCGRKAHAPDAAAGKMAKCKCGSKVRIPDAAGVVAGSVNPGAAPPVAVDLDASADAYSPPWSAAPPAPPADADDDAAEPLDVPQPPAPSPVYQPPIGSGAWPSSPPPWFLDLMDRWQSHPNAKPARAAMPKEPWYYWALEVYAIICAALGVTQFVIVVLIWIVGVAGAGAVAEDGRAAAGAMALGTPFVVISFAWMLVIFLVVAPILLAVDAARNVRAIRYEGR